MNSDIILKAKKKYMNTVIPDALDKAIEEGILRGEKELFNINEDIISDEKKINLTTEDTILGDENISKIKKGNGEVTCEGTVNYKKEDGLLKKKRKGRFLKPISILAACLILFIMGINLSPAFASLFDNVPGVNSIVELLRVDENLNIASKKGYKFDINKSCEDKNIKLTINSVIMDSRKMIVSYSLETSMDYNDLLPSLTKLTDKNGSLINNVFFTFTSFFDHDKNFINTKKRDGIFEIQYHDPSALPDEIVFNIYEIREGSTSDRKVEGNWSVSFNANFNIPREEPKVYPVNKVVENGDVKFTVDEIKIYPTVIDVSIIEDMPFKLNFDNIYLKDSLGRKYKLIQDFYDVDKRILSFQSNYFIKSKSLSLIIDKMTEINSFNDEDNYLYFDLNNKNIKSSKDYEIEYIRDEKISDPENPNSLIVYFKANLPKDEYLLLDSLNAYDETGNKYLSMSISSEKEDETIENGIMFKNIKSNLETLKIKLLGYYKVYNKKIELKIK